MPNLPPSQLQSMLGHLDQALYNHEQWYKNVTRVLIARLPTDPPDLKQDAHLHCRFGQWYESADAASLREYPTFVALGQAHEQMHRLAAGMLQRANDNLPIPAVQFDQFNNVLDRMRLEIQSLRHELSETLLNRDALTGARNRATLLSDLREQQALVRRGVQSCALAMLDLDHFKRINDVHGHLAGDAALAAAVQCVQSHLRPYDRIYRYGGEEFLLCLPNTDLAMAEAMAQRLRTAIEALAIVVAGAGAAATLRVTVSIGVAPLDAEVPIEQSIDRADEAMYAAKAGGRNRVESWAQRAGIKNGGPPGRA